VHSEEAHRAAAGGDSWYLDPLVAEQKRRVHQELVRRWSRGVSPRTVLKTDVFEEANGDDRILFDLFPSEAHAVGMDIAPGYLAAARKRAPENGFSFVRTDVRACAFATGSFDLVLSNSTLDHFATRGELRAALKELVRILRPGGVLIVTLDNPENPMYALLRWVTGRNWTPFVLGETASIRQLNTWLAECGVEITANEWLIHNPRLISTGLFMILRKLFGRFADPPVRTLLWMFALAARLPTRRFSACFVAACARKPVRNPDAT
jgi:SAM-dependent methyltransferase